MYLLEQKREDTARQSHLYFFESYYSPAFLSSDVTLLTWSRVLQSLRWFKEFIQPT